MGSSTTVRTRQSRALLSLIARVAISLVALAATVSYFPDFQPPDRVHSKALVVASSRATARSAVWLSRVPLDWSVFHYVTDDELAPLSVPADKGNEAMVYLTYIIDHYADLPDVVFFHHDHYKAWHQHFDSIFEVSNIRTSYVLEQGLVSPRCQRGCENIVRLGDEFADLKQFHLVDREVQLNSLMAAFLDEHESIPTKIASPCHGQFAASRRAIRGRSLEWWKRMRQWLIDTPLTSSESGRLLEFTWHIWLGQPAEICSATREECLCKTFGHGDNCV
ncbi:hypothetical protein BX600DRAFT_510499 [Xylariales sp. PMI_506]|nr:hypothetical protein BX600DRAFT_510499 [Xylariales sp. PMI_506]